MAAAVLASACATPAPIVLQSPPRGWVLVAPVIVNKTEAPGETQQTGAFEDASACEAERLRRVQNVLAVFDHAPEPGDPMERAEVAVHLVGRCMPLR